MVPYKEICKNIYVIVFCWKYVSLIETEYKTTFSRQILSVSSIKLIKNKLNEYKYKFN